jgi:hypothetical protein
MPTHACVDLPRGSWQRPATRQSAALGMHASIRGMSYASRSADARPRLTSADEDDAEASSSNRSYGPTASGAAPVRRIRSIGGGGQ